MSVKLSTPNKRRLFARLRAKAPKLERAIEDAALKSAEEIAGMARGLAPVRTGALRDSIVVTAAGGSTPGGNVIPEGAAAVSVGNYKARFVEFGTAEASAQPFFFDSYRANRKRALSRIGRAVNKVLKG